MFGDAQPSASLSQKMQLPLHKTPWQELCERPGIETKLGKLLWLGFCWVFSLLTDVKFLSNLLIALICLKGTISDWCFNTWVRQIIDDDCWICFEIWVQLNVTLVRFITEYSQRKQGKREKAHSKALRMCGLGLFLLQHTVEASLSGANIWSKRWLDLT